MMQLSYSSQLLRILPGTIREKVTFVFPVSNRSAYGALLAYENETWIMAVGSLAGQQPPVDRASLIAAAEQFAPPSLLTAVRAAEPISDGCCLPVSRECVATVRQDAAAPRWTARDR